MEKQRNPCQDISWTRFWKLKIQRTGRKSILFTKEKTIWETADFSSETIEARVKWHSMSNAERILAQKSATAAKSLQSCPTLCDPMDGSPPGSVSLGFSRQEHWSGLPFPSPMHESEKRKWSRSVMSDSQRPHGLQPTRLLHPWDFPGKSTGVGCHCLLQVAA